MLTQETKQTPSIKNEWHQELPKEKWIKLCEDSLTAQLNYVKFNPLRFGACGR